MTLDDKASLAIVLCDVLLVDTARGIFFPTLWAHVKQLGGDKIALGYCVGAFSLGRWVGRPMGLTLGEGSRSFRPRSAMVYKIRLPCCHRQRRTNPFVQ